MDKRMVISAYRRGFLSLKECAQLLGTDTVHILKLINDPQLVEQKRTYPKRKSVSR